jgi:hypothetical protein
MPVNFDDSRLLRTSFSKATLVKIQPPERCFWALSWFSEQEPRGVLLGIRQCESSSQAKCRLIGAELRYIGIYTIGAAKHEP